MYLCIIWMKPCWSCTEITVCKIYILICCCYCFKINFFVRLTLFFCEAGYTEIFFLIWAKWIFLCVHLDRQKKTCVFLCVYFFFLCGLTHKKISFNLGEYNFSVRVRPTEKLFLTVNSQKNVIFLSLYFCGYFSEDTPSEKYFSDGICIFLCVFAHTEKSEIPVVLLNLGFSRLKCCAPPPSLHDVGLNPNNLPLSHTLGCLRHMWRSRFFIGFSPIAWFKRR